jgi:hypothetical protein
LLGDLHEIIQQARQLQATDDPSPSVWNSIAIALRREGLIRPTTPNETLLESDPVVRPLQADSMCAHPLEDERHVRSCPECAGVMRELDTITAQAQILLGSEEPSPRVWNSIEMALRKEGLIHPPQVELPELHAHPRWKLSWLVPLAGTAVVILGMVLFQNGDGWRKAATAPQLASVAPVNVQDSPDSAPTAEEEQMVQLVSDRTPSLTAAYQADLKAVRDYIRDAEKSVRANPQDQLAQQHLRSAYEEQAMVYEMAMSRLQ